MIDLARQGLSRPLTIFDPPKVKWIGLSFFRLLTFSYFFPFPIELQCFVGFLFVQRFLLKKQPSDQSLLSASLVRSSTRKVRVLPCSRRRNQTIPGPLCIPVCTFCRQTYPKRNPHPSTSTPQNPNIQGFPELFLSSTAHPKPHPSPTLIIRLGRKSLGAARCVRATCFDGGLKAG